MENSLVLAILGMKQFFIVFFAAVAGALSHALNEVRTNGWKGWLNFASDTFICVFFGFVFHQLGIVIAPEKAIIFTALGSFWGTESFKYLRNWFIKSLQANLPKS